MQTKICSKCGRELSLDNFYKKKDGKYGVSSICKDCSNAISKEYYENNREKINLRCKEYRETNKEKISLCNKEYHEKNKEKIKLQMKEYRENNKEHYKDLFKKYYENNKDKYKEYNHKRRALKVGNGGSYTKAQWLDTLEYFDYKCAYTGECIKHSCHVEHIVPISKGGTSYIWNLVPSTASANLSKNNRDMEEWYREQEYFCEERLNKISEYQRYMAAKYK